MALQNWNVDPKRSSVTFSARHLMFARVSGRFEQWGAELELDEDAPERSHVVARIQASSLSTDDRARDDNLRSDDMLAVARHPEIAFAGKRIRRLGPARYVLTGDLTIAGTTRSVDLDVNYRGKTADPRGGERAGFSARTSISRKEFGLHWSAAVEAGGLLVSDKIEIAVELEVVRSA
jgi:polyisoprenoid-binding protein YceI